jgi:hypothetical protein
MEEFIISETSKIFTKGIKRYVKKYSVDEHDVSILLYIKSSEDVGYQIYVGSEFKEEVTIKDILGVKVMDLKGYSVIAPPYIHQFLLKFKVELRTDKVDVSIYLDENGEDVRFFLYGEGELIREVYLKNLLGFKIEV